MRFRAHAGAHVALPQGLQGGQAAPLNNRRRAARRCQALAVRRPGRCCDDAAVPGRRLAAQGRLHETGGVAAHLSLARSISPPHPRRHVASCLGGPAAGRCCVRDSSWWRSLLTGASGARRRVSGHKGSVGRRLNARVIASSKLDRGRSRRSPCVSGLVADPPDGPYVHLTPTDAGSQGQCTPSARRIGRHGVRLEYSPDT